MKTAYLVPFLPPRRACSIALALIFATSLLAAADNTGSIVGRVLNADTQGYVYDAQIQVVGTDLRAESDQSGTFRLHGIPAGQATLHIVYPGLQAADVAVDVPAGRTATADVTLQSTPSRANPGIVKLDPYQVNVSKEMSNTELAVNSQRYASNLKTVIAVDDLGFIGDGNIANAMKFLPGVDLEEDGYGYGNAITLSGAPSANVPITYGGFQMTTTADGTQGLAAPGLSATPQRSTQLMQMSLNNISRIEINHSTLPDDPGSALAGSVNFVPKSAFEYTQPKYLLSVFGATDQNTLRKGSMNGPFSSNINTKFPGLVLSAIVPVNQRFGFSVTFSTNTLPKAYVSQTEAWNANYIPASGTYSNTPLNPTHYFSDGQQLASILNTYQRTNVNITADYKVSEYGTLHATFTQAYNQLQYGDRHLAWGNTAWVNKSTSTLTDEYEINNTSLQPRVLNETLNWQVVDANRQESLDYTHEIGDWKFDLGESYGNSRKQNQDADVGTVFSILYNIRPLKELDFNNIGSWGPANITAVAPNGTVVTPGSLASFVAAGNFTTTYYNATTGAVTTVNSTLPALRFKPLWASDHRFEGKGSASRFFDLRNFPTTVKIGFDYQEYSRTANTDPNLGGNGSGFIYLGNLPGTTWILNNYNTPMIGNYGVPQVLDPVALGHYFNANQNLFVESRPWNDYTSAATTDYYLEEVVPAGYIRFDSSLFKNRLKLAYGIRYEQTRDVGLGPYYNPAGNYVTNAQGQYLATTGAVYVAGSGQTIATKYPVDSLAWAHAMYTIDGAEARGVYNNFFPSAAVSYDVTPNIVARVSYSHTVGRPDLGNIYPSLNLPDPTTFTEATATKTITVNNPALHPWQSDNIGLSLEYYSPDGQSNVSLRGYRRFVQHAFATTNLDEDQSSAYLTQYGIDPTQYPGAIIQVPMNLPGSIVTSGLELSGGYSFDKILPEWARGLRVDISGTRSTQTGGGPAAVQFAAQNLYIVPWTAGIGVSMTRKRFSIALRTKVDSKTRLQYEDYTAAKGTYDPNTYLYRKGEWRTNLDANLQLTRNLSLFVNGQDITGYQLTLQIYSPTTPDVAKNYYRAIYQPVWTAGMKAQF